MLVKHCRMVFGLTVMIFMGPTKVGRIMVWHVSSVRPSVLLEDQLYYWKINCDVGRSVVLLEDQLYWRQSTRIDGNYRSRKITARRWLHKYVGAECGASSFTWYLYQICNTDVRPSVNVWLSTGVTTCQINLNFTDILHLVRPIHDTGNGPCSTLNMRILTQLLIFAFWSFLRPFFKLEPSNLV